MGMLWNCNLETGVKHPSSCSRPWKGWMQSTPKQDAKWSANFKVPYKNCQDSARSRQTITYWIPRINKVLHVPNSNFLHAVVMLLFLSTASFHARLSPVNIDYRNHHMSKSITALIWTPQIDVTTLLEDLTWLGISTYHQINSGYHRLIAQIKITIFSKAC